MMCDSLGTGIDPPLTEEPITDPDQGVKRNHSQGESSSSSDAAGDMKKQKLEGGDSKKEIPGHTQQELVTTDKSGNTGNNGKTGNTGNNDIGSVFATQTWEAYFATWDCRKKARGILAKSGMLGASQSGQSGDHKYRVTHKVDY